MATYVTIDNLQHYDTKLKAYVETGYYQKPEIDAFLSEIAAHEATFITKSVDDLVNYYTKTETYTKTEVNNLVDTIPKFNIQVVDVLPTEDISSTTIYLVPKQFADEDIYDEYIYVADAWELLGSQTIDLSDYYTKEEVDDLISDMSEYVRTNDLDEVAVTGIRGVNDNIYQTGNVTLNKGMVGLSQVENKSSAVIRSEITEGNITAALQYQPFDSADWTANTANADGYVPKTNGIANKAWATDSNGAPGWRDYTGVANNLDFTGSLNGVLPTANGGTGNSDGYIHTGQKENTNVGTGTTIEGVGNTATSNYAHAEGNNVTVSGTASHAEGYNTNVAGSYSSATGHTTTAGYDYQHVSGKYNNNKATTLLEVGNGASNVNRANAFEVYSDGYISTAEGARIKFGKDGNNVYGYYEDGSNTLVPFGSTKTALSQFTNDVGFITNAVNDLQNYYLKTETYTKTEVNGLISSIPLFDIQVVTELPTTEISTTTIYLLLSGDESSNLYDEYIYVDDSWEKLGTQSVDLTGYFNTSSVIPIVNGGTNATTAASARTNLGVGNVGTLNTNGSTDNYLRGDGTWATPPGKDYTAGTGLSLTGTQFNVTTISVANGGTGATDAQSARQNLEIGSVGTLDYGSGTTTYLRNDGNWATPPDTKDLSEMTGTLSISKGGTGATDSAGARSNLGIGNVGTLTYGNDTTKYLRNDGTWVVPETGSDFDYDIVEEEPDVADMDEGEVVFVIGENYENDLVTTTTQDLEYYYLKSQTYTKAEIDALIGAIPKFAIAVVNALPTTDISTTTVYLLRSGDTSQNLYTEYIYVNNAWEMLGTQAIDLSGYVRTTDTIAVAHGGTGATTAANARTNLGIGNVGTFSTNGSTSSFLRGDGSWATPPGETYTAGTGLTLSNANQFSVSTVPIANGGTGLNASPSMLVNLESTAADDVMKASPRPGVTGVLPVANGGTGASTVAGARNALGLGNTSGALPIESGGTGATDASGARTNLGLGSMAMLNYYSSPIYSKYFLDGTGVWGSRDAINIVKPANYIEFMYASTSTSVAKGGSLTVATGLRSAIPYSFSTSSKYIVTISGTIVFTATQALNALHIKETAKKYNSSTYETETTLLGLDFGVPRVQASRFDCPIFHTFIVDNCYDIKIDLGEIIGYNSSWAETNSVTFSKVFLNGYCTVAQVYVY